MFLPFQWQLLGARARSSDVARRLVGRLGAIGRRRPKRRIGETPPQAAGGGPSRQTQARLPHLRQKN